ncbi:magnesium chelatase subunit D [Candidatus Phycosocius spiralis]|uniref:Mg-protoporphyrin IX chelatase n=1 Tax=Candidatus Phycosocius spiralis TaxID=2815099 RepID=A0ABQ4PUM5_9PROT|nr:magnesium chelatase subunit D [Candidatus Phycosocius spiralis]GIU66674.1 Mg-protoporphyrin IX chelatase [Candidatus Phycosocius spiralis]
MRQVATPKGKPCATWPDALLIAAIFAIDPHIFGGVVLRGRHGPLSDAWLEILTDLLPEATPIRRCPLHIGDDRLLGGLDLATSLALGRPVVQRGLLSEADGGVLVLPMAERMQASTASRITSALDSGQFQLERDGLTSVLPARFGVLLFDESFGPEEAPPAALLERCSLCIDTDVLKFSDLSDDGPSLELILKARVQCNQITLSDPALIDAICDAVTAFGLESARPALACLNVARAVTALDGRSMAGLADITLAARLVLAPQALQLPQDTHEVQPQAEPEIQSEQENPPAEPTNPDQAEASDPQTDTTPPPEGQDLSEQLIEAVKSALPSEVIAALSTKAKCPTPRGAIGAGSGQHTKSPLRGRPIRSRAGTLKPGERLNLIDTLRAAAPWQKIRKSTMKASRSVAGPKRIEVRKSDFRIRCFAQPREATTILVVDASGSSAFQRLAEAKGAVELLLAQAYVDRNRVAMVSFRNEGAQILLPPTRSLARARRQLADLAGGGGTPLAAGMDTALTLALSEKAKGRTPRLLFLTDGRANIDRDGKAGRKTAMAHAFSAARAIAHSGIATIHLDTSPIPRPEAKDLAKAMGATYAPLPYLNAQAISAMG